MSRDRADKQSKIQTNIEFFEEVFQPSFCDFLLRDSQSKLSSGHEFTHSNYHWPGDIVRASQPVLVRRYDPALSAIILAQLVKRGVIGTGEFVVMNYAWSRLSYIPWHNDRTHELAITVYLNDEWDRDWGGVFLYLDEAAGIRGFAPKFNTCVKNTGHILHSTTMITVDACAPRLTLQIFPKKP